MYGGQTPVSTACRHGNVPTLKALIAAGADVNKMPPVANFHGTRIDNGRSPLWDAADQGARAHPERTELTRLFPAHDDAAKKKSKKKAPSRGVGLPDPLFRRVVMFWLG